MLQLPIGCPSKTASAEWKHMLLLSLIGREPALRENQPCGPIWRRADQINIREAFMVDLYTCSCGNQTWEIFDTGVRCVACKTEYATLHMPVAEFNHAVAEELEEALEE